MKMCSMATSLTSHDKRSDTTSDSVEPGQTRQGNAAIISGAGELKESMSAPAMLQGADQRSVRFEKVRRSLAERGGRALRRAFSRGSTNSMRKPKARRGKLSKSSLYSQEQITVKYLIDELSRLYAKSSYQNRRGTDHDERLAAQHVIGFIEQYGDRATSEPVRPLPHEITRTLHPLIRDYDRGQARKQGNSFGQVDTASILNGELDNLSSIFSRLYTAKLALGRLVETAANLLEQAQIELDSDSSPNDSERSAQQELRISGWSSYDSEITTTFRSERAESPTVFAGSVIENDTQVSGIDSERSITSSNSTTLIHLESQIEDVLTQMETWCLCLGSRAETVLAPLLPYSVASAPSGAEGGIQQSNLIDAMLELQYHLTPIAKTLSKQTAPLYDYLTSQDPSLRGVSSMPEITSLPEETPSSQNA